MPAVVMKLILANSIQWQKGVESSEADHAVLCGIKIEHSMKQYINKSLADGDAVHLRRTEL